MLIGSSLDCKNIEKSFTLLCDKLMTYEQVYVSVSGGSDSDILIDLIYRAKERGYCMAEVHYIFFDTGVEFQASKDHLTYLEKTYQIEIEKINPAVPVPLAVHRYGQPFLSKYVSMMVSRLQNHGFQWEDEPFDVLMERYPNCKGALSWWSNTQSTETDGMFNINHNPYLRDFMIANPPTFTISADCCTYSKKLAASNVLVERGADLSIVGVRKAEGGIRSQSISSCFSEGKDGGADVFRPIFWYSNKDKQLYESVFGIKHSACYTDYYLRRTGCAGCPFGFNFEEELQVLKEYEPKLYKAVSNIFKDSYEYTRAYREFVKKKKAEV